MSKQKLSAFGALLLGIVLVVGFQNCAKNQIKDFASQTDSELSENTSVDQEVEIAQENLTGTYIPLRKVTLDRVDAVEGAYNQVNVGFAADGSDFSAVTCYMDNKEIPCSCSMFTGSMFVASSSAHRACRFYSTYKIVKLQLPAEISNSYHSFSFKFTLENGASIQTSSRSARVVADRYDPTASIKIFAGSSATIQQSRFLALNLTASDTESGLDPVRTVCLADGVENKGMLCISGSSPTQSLSTVINARMAALSVGPHVISVKVYDKAGRSKISNTLNINVTAP